MSVIQRYIVLLAICFVSFHGISQLGYLGKRVGIEAGLTSNFSLISGDNNFHNYASLQQVLLPKVSLGFLRENKRGSVVHWQTMFHALPDSRVSSTVMTEENGTSSLKSDTVWTRSRNLQLSFGIRKFRELSPVGFYFEFSLKGNVVFNKSLYQSDVKNTYENLNYFESNTTYSVLNEVVLIPEVGMSIGSTYPINDKFLLDFGGNLNFPIGTLKDKEHVKNELPNSSVIHKVVSSKKLLGANLLELYVNIILFP